MTTSAVRTYASRVARRASAGAGAGTALLGLAVVIGSASPAWADTAGSASKPSGLGLLETVVLFGVVPAVAIALVTVAVYLPSWLRSPRYRPTEAWDHDALWFGGPDDPDTAVQQADPGSGTRGGTSGGW